MKTGLLLAVLVLISWHVEAADRVLLIGINDYQDAKIGGSETSKSDRDGTYIAYTTGVVYDKNTGLEWFAGPDRNTNWNDAKAWVESLNVGGGWRMPTRTELEALYQEGAGTRNMTPLLNTNGWWVWSESKDSSSAWGFNFYDGNENWSYLGFSSSRRGFAVHSRRQ